MAKRKNITNMKNAPKKLSDGVYSVKDGRIIKIADSENSLITKELHNQETGILYQALVKERTDRLKEISKHGQELSNIIAEGVLFEEKKLLEEFDIKYPITARRLKSHKKILDNAKEQFFVANLEFPGVINTLTEKTIQVAESNYKNAQAEYLNVQAEYNNQLARFISENESRKSIKWQHITSVAISSLITAVATTILVLFTAPHI